MYRLDVVKANEGFDEDFFCYVEDIDLAFRLRLKGYACLLVPDAVVSHMGAATSGSKTSTFAIYYGHRNMVWAFVKNMPGVLFWLLLPLHLLINLLSIAWFSYRGYAAIILKAKRDALLGLPMMWKKRKIIQSGRKISVFSIWKILNKSVFIR